MEIMNISTKDWYPLNFEGDIDKGEFPTITHEGKVLKPVQVCLQDYNP